MGRKGSGEKAQSLEPRKAGMEGGAEEARDRNKDEKQFLKNGGSV